MSTDRRIGVQAPIIIMKIRPMNNNIVVEHVEAHEHSFTGRVIAVGPGNLLDRLLAVDGAITGDGLQTIAELAEIPMTSVAKVAGVFKRQVNVGDTVILPNAGIRIQMNGETFTIIDANDVLGVLEFDELTAVSTTVAT